MFIGDRGHGVRSIIKGHQQFGGHWKEKIHGRRFPFSILLFIIYYPSNTTGGYHQKKKGQDGIKDSLCG